MQEELLAGDFLSKGYPNAGRVVTCQLSVIMGLPLSCLVLKGLPTAAVGENTSMNTLAVTYGVALFTMGIAISWCAAPLLTPPLWTLKPCYTWISLSSPRMFAIHEA